MRAMKAFVTLLSACTLASAALGLFAYLQVPDGATVAIHFDSAGRANGWAQPASAFLSMPLVCVGFLLFHGLLPRLKPGISTMERNLVAGGFAFIGVAMLVGQAAIVAHALGTVGNS